MARGSENGRSNQSAMNIDSHSPLYDKGPAHDKNPVHDKNIASLIEGEIIPRLLMAHRLGGGSAVPSSNNEKTIIRDQDVAYIAELALDHDADMLFRHMADLESRGVSTERLLIECIAPAAALLGERWEDDRIDFIDVTMAVWRLQESVHILATRRPGRAAARDGAKHALFSVMPGDQHNLGTQIIDEFFRRAGWETQCLMATTEPELIATVRHSSPDVVGLTVSSDESVDDLPRLIAAIRAASSNPRLAIMLGGCVFNGNSALAVRLGADGAAKDARAAVEMANELVLSITAQSMVAQSEAAF